MQQRHLKRKQYFDEQGITTKKHVIPYIEQSMTVDAHTSVLEIGCGEGGNMVPFIERGCKVVGVDISEYRIQNALRFLQEHMDGNNVQLLTQDIYKVDPEVLGCFDLIIMRDVIEHIPNQERFLTFVKQFLTPNGKIFFGFPPWRMPFGGHQQVCRSKFLSKLPYFHLLGKAPYAAVLRLFGEKEKTIQELMEVKETGISLRRFEHILAKANYRILHKDLYLFNPNYEIKFGLQPRKLGKMAAAVPYFRDFYTTCCYCLVGLHDAEDTSAQSTRLETTNGTAV
ncbi:MAG: class I SAM-dependent methyltransferase [Bacteroidota bacterium]